MAQGHERVLHSFMDRLLRDVEEDRIIIITDDPSALSYAPETAIVVTPSEEVLRKARDYRARLLVDAHVIRGLSGLDDVRTIILETIALGHLDLGHTLVLVLMEGLPTSALIVDPSDEPLVGAMRLAVERGIEARVFQSVLSLGVQVAREGREGHPAGALFILGDEKQIMDRCAQGVLNPFKGHPIENRDVRKPESAGSIKTYATVDGAVAVNKQGTAVAAGLYVLFEAAALQNEKLGGRHLAAYAITRDTDALAVVVSQEGTVRVVADGREMASMTHVR